MSREVPMARSATCIISEETSSGSTALASSLQIPRNKNLAPTAQSGRPSELVCGCRCVAIVVAQRVTQRGWCRKRMQPRCVSVSTWAGSRREGGGPISSESSSSSSAQPAARSARGKPFHLKVSWGRLSTRR
eukprot:scaffold4823_cov60-Phaeocystis_antarctica.AAC.1